MIPLRPDVHFNLKVLHELTFFYLKTEKMNERQKEEMVF